MSEVFAVCLRLGLTSFGGPTAHLGYYRREFVERRGWIDAATLSALIAFCSVLPGPTSSQVLMLIGALRAGPGGAFAAWLAFTAPSALLLALVAFAFHAVEGRPSLTESGWFAGLLTGLTAAAAAVVAQAVLALARTLCTDAGTKTIALGATVVAIGVNASPGLQWLPIALGAAIGALALHGRTAIDVPELALRVPRWLAVACGAGFAAIVVGVLLASTTRVPTFVLLATIGRAGSLVFGGGHVVLPLLQGLVDAGLVSSRDFFAGYGVAQAVPGPLFTFASYLGAINGSPLTGALGACVATVGIFVPSFALLFALAPIWNRVRHAPRAAAVLAGTNASVVGLLASVLYHPVLTALQASGIGIGIALVAYAAIAVWSLPPWIVVVTSAGLGALAGAFG